MAELVKYIYGTEVQILGITPTSIHWFEKGFYYPSDKTYFYQAINGVMKKYGAAEIEQEDVEMPPPNIIAIAGVGLDSNKPAASIFKAGDVYISKDTFQKSTVNSNLGWDVSTLVDSQFITDISIATELPPLYQFFNNILMPIANYAPDGLPDGLPSLPE